MKRIFIITIILAVLLTACAPKVSSTITRNTIVVKLDRVSDIVTCMDTDGNLWEFEGCEDWLRGDGCKLIFDTMGTSTIYDDVIVETIYFIEK